MPRKKKILHGVVSNNFLLNNVNKISYPISHSISPSLLRFSDKTFSFRIFFSQSWCSAIQFKGPNALNSNVFIFSNSKGS